MIKNQNIYLEPVYECEFEFKCSLCEGGSLKVKKDSLNKRQTNSAKEFYEMTGDIHEEDSSRFSLLLECKNCDEVYCVAGTISLREYNGYCGFESCENTYQEYRAGGIEDSYGHRHNYYNVKYINPQINIFTVPDQTTDDIKNILTRSFTLFWCDKEASANKIRTALEFLMNHFNIDKTYTNKKGEEYTLSLNHRLNLFKSHKDFGHLSEKLLAIKLLGNAGSHESVTKEDLLNAYEILEYVLEECFQRPERVNSLIKKAENLSNKYGAV
jgi:hypothetical protein